MAQDDAAKQQEANRVMQALQSKGVTDLTCPSCGKVVWQFEGYGLATSGAKANESVSVTEGVKVAVMVCTNCGLIREHSARFLGLIP